MCRIVVLAETIPHPDLAQDWKRLKRGDVCEVFEDGTYLGKHIEDPPEALKNRVVIIELPGVPASDARHLCAEEAKGSDPMTGVALPRNLRAQTLDLTALGFDGTSRLKMLQKAEVLARVKTKAAWRDPRVIG